jgi:5'-methylthioadenosine phosphorylase
MPNEEAKVAVIGGSGLYEIDGLTEVTEVEPKTPFGKPSDVITIGNLDGTNVAFLPRHGRGHTISPGEVPFRANIYALKSLGVERIIAVNAVGSFRRWLKPGELVIPDQIIDRTRHREDSFFGGGIVVHIPFADPFCSDLSRIVYMAARKTKIKTHWGGTYLAMEGPAFSTRAESRLYRSWKADIIGMTGLPEAKLAREAEICYAMIAGVTDYDSWQKQSQVLVASEIMKALQNNVEAIKEIITRAVANIPEERPCQCATALSEANATSPKYISAALKKKLDLLIGKYLRGDS